MSLKVSHYLTVSANSYQDRFGGVFRLALSGRIGTLTFVRAPEAIQLELGKLPTDPKVIERLRRAKILVEESEDEIKTMIERNKEACEDLSDLSFVLAPSSFCNMGCSYCGQFHSKGGLSDKWERAVIARVETGIRRPTTKTVDVGWFGGEPMVGYHSLLRVSSALTAIADEVGVSYSSSITTNGSLLTVQKLLKMREVGRINLVEITLDGPAEVHDQRRKLKNGSGSFRHITDVISTALKTTALEGMYFRIRTNIDLENADFVMDYLHEMKQLGFAHERVTFDLHAVYPWSNDVSEVELEKERYAEQEIAWMITMLSLGLRFTAVPKGFRGVVCAAVTPSTEVISSTGKIFSCTEHILVPRHEANDVLASVYHPPSGPRPKGLFDDFNARVAEKKVPCHGCKVFGICGGACPKHWAEGLVPCPSFKYNLQGRFDIAAVQNGLRIL